VSDKRSVKKGIRQLQRIQTWQLVVLFLIVSLVGATFLRLNNIGMYERRTAVMDADKAGGIDTIQSRLYDLQRYSSEHMNAGSGAFYLEQQYRRDVQVIVEKAKASDVNPNGNINVQADATCKTRYGQYSQAYVRCVRDELAKFPPSPDPQQNLVFPNTELYRHETTSPLWSPDFAGFFILFAIGIVVVIIARVIGIAVLRILLRRHYKAI
jgi:hypothetical protein